MGWPTQNNIVPYIPRTCATLLLPAPSSDVVPMSYAIVFETTAVVSKTIAYDIGTTSELGAGKRRVAHVLGMYGTILFWVGQPKII